MKLKYCMAFVVAAAASLGSCTDKFADPTFYDSADVDFTYNVAGDEYTLDFYVVSSVQFNNTSSKSGSFTWDFGDGTTSNEVSPTHKYAAAGNYKVTLTLDGVGQRTYPLMIYDIAPVLSVDTQSTDIVEYNNTTLTFNLELPNPENLPVKYEWTFPEGTSYADGTPVTTFTGYAHEDGTVDYPDPVKFSNIGSQRVSIVTTFDTRDNGENRRLSDTYLNVQVGTSEPAPTLYYAQRGGNIKAIKLIDNVPAGTKVMPYDMGVSAGSTVFNLLCNTTAAVSDESDEATQDWIYILDAGKQYYYINDEDGVLGDGTMTAMHADGTGVNVVVTNVGGPAFMDPFRGFIQNGIIYYSDRNAGFSQIDCTTRGAVQEVTLDGSTWRRASYVMTNENTPFKDQGISWGAITNGIYKDSAGWWWIGKNYNGQGVFRFRDSDVYSSETEAKKHALPSAVLLSGEFTSTFAVDEVHNMFYAYRSSPSQAFLAFPLVDTNTELKLADALYNIPMDCTPENTTSAEGMFVTQMAVDSATGKVYFCYRPESGDTSGIHAGIAVFDPATGEISNYGETTDLGTGIVINPTKTKLF
jgi:PKD repeat protein